MASCSAELNFVSVGPNRVGHCTSWGRNNLVAYGGHNFVALYKPDVSK